MLENSWIQRAGQPFLQVCLAGLLILLLAGCSKPKEVAKSAALDVDDLDAASNRRFVPRAPFEVQGSLPSGEQTASESEEAKVEQDKDRERGKDAEQDVEKVADQNRDKGANQGESGTTPSSSGDAAASEQDPASKPDQSTDPQMEQPAGTADAEDGAEAPQFDLSQEQTIEIPATWRRMGQNEIWLDMKNKQVILGGYVCINVGALEMFACPAGTKEHEAIVGVNARADEMHALLIAAGAKPGAPCSWDEDSFTSASGSRISIDVRWRDEMTGEVITRSAKEMMKIDEKPASNVEFIFGGSRIHKYPDSEKGYYVANSGEMICVSNFSTAAIDVNIDSSDTNASLLFWANTEKVPPRGTRVYLILTPGEFFEAQRHVFADQAKPTPEAAPDTAQPPIEETKPTDGGQPETQPSDSTPKSAGPETDSNSPQTDAAGGSGAKKDGH